MHCGRRDRYSNLNIADSLRLMETAQVHNTSKHLTLAIQYVERFLIDKNVFRRIDARDRARFIKCCLRNAIMYDHDPTATLLIRLAIQKL